MGLLWEGHGPTVAVQLDTLDARLAAVAVAIASEDRYGCDEAARNVEDYLDDLDEAELRQILLWARWPLAAQQGDSLVAVMDAEFEGELTVRDVTLRAALRPVREVEG